MNRFWITGPHREIVWPCWFKSRAQATAWRDRWAWGEGCRVIRA